MKKLRLFALVTHIAVEAILLIILFTTVPKARLGEPVFWIAWSFSFVLNLLIAVGLFFFTRKKAAEWLTIPPLYYVSYVINGIYLIVGIIFMYAPITNQVSVWVVESILTIVFFVLSFYFILGSSYINQNTKHVKEKVQYIREANVICDSSLNVATHEDSKKALNKLSEEIKYSDPMSNESVANYEKKFLDTLLDIDTQLQADESSDVTELVKKASQILTRRNALVKIRK